ncbi:hypothetical protein [Aminipila terrae]|uniref:Uncharacterized protein n=1 Tax=Aminipila terrae TaxID=2697030 RepID=A0A6P1MG53_9FIRM|nr:hypothetical protein [Aminipila terrae]QHI72877.1 hypothetical protein Ami3637_11085 [Aminipila terrae]
MNKLDGTRNRTECQIEVIKEKAPTEAATSDVSAHSNNQVKNTSDSKNCQDALNNI